MAEDRGNVLALAVAGAEWRIGRERLERQTLRIAGAHPPPDGRRLSGTRQLGRKRRGAEDRGRATVADDVGKLVPHVGDVERDRRYSELLAGVVGEDELRAIREVEARPVAGTEPEPGETRRQAAGLPVELRVCETPVPEDERRPVREAAGARLEDVRDVHPRSVRISSAADRCHSAAC